MEKLEIKFSDMSVFAKSLESHQKSIEFLLSCNEKAKTEMAQKIYLGLVEVCEVYNVIALSEIASGYWAGREELETLYEIRVHIKWFCSCEKKTYFPVEMFDKYGINLFEKDGE